MLRGLIGFGEHIVSSLQSKCHALEAEYEIMQPGFF